MELQGEEASDAIDEPGPTEHMNEYYSSPLQLSTDPEEPQTESYDGTNSWDSTSTPLPAAELPTLVNGIIVCIYMSVPAFFGECKSPKLGSNCKI